MMTDHEITIYEPVDKEKYREILRRQSGTLELEQGKYSKYRPYVYTESGVAMLTFIFSKAFHNPAWNIKFSYFSLVN